MDSWTWCSFFSSFRWFLAAYYSVQSSHDQIISDIFFCWSCEEFFKARNQYFIVLKLKRSDFQYPASHSPSFFIHRISLPRRIRFLCQYTIHLQPFKSPYHDGFNDRFVQLMFYWRITIYNILPGKIVFMYYKIKSIESQPILLYQ